MFTAENLVRVVAHPSPKAVLVCFGQAGAGVSAFRPWRKHVHEDLELIAVRLPGREKLFAQPPLRELSQIGVLAGDALVTLAATGAAPSAPGGAGVGEAVPGGAGDGEASGADAVGPVRVGLFGYCAGAFAALETARRMTQRQAPPSLLAVCSQVPPHTGGGRSSVHTLPDAALREFFGSLPGAGQAAAEDELWELMEPAVRADYEALETYSSGPDPKITCDLVAVRGRDDAELTEPQLRRWAELTTGASTTCQLNGGHYLLESAGAEVLSLVQRYLLTPGGG
jgi:surfactin synthase thioesterase subunit